MSTLTVYADNADGYLNGASATYLTARANISYLSSNTDRLRFGQYYDGSYHVSESFVRFDTSALPDTATITNVVISFTTLWGETMREMGSTPLICRVYAKDWGTSLSGSDGVPGANIASTCPVCAHKTITTEADWPADNTVITFTSSTEELANFINAIDKTGYTKLMLAYDWLEIAHTNTGMNYADICSGNNATQTKRPKLVITYTEGTNCTVPVDCIQLSASVPDSTVLALSPTLVQNNVDCIELSVDFNTVTVTTTSSVVVDVPCIQPQLMFPGAKLPDSGNRDIDGFLIYVHQGTEDSAPYVFGTEPSKEQVHVVPYDVRNYKLYGLPTDKYYHFMVRSYRMVDQDIDPSGMILSIENQSQFPTNGYALTLDTVPRFGGDFMPTSTNVPTDFTGLYGNSEKLGYIDQGVWKTYQDNQGRMYFVGPGENSFSWDGSKIQIVVDDPQGGIVLKGGSLRSYGKSAYANLEPGFWLGQDSDDNLYKFNFGSDSNYIRWTGSELEVLGNIKAGSRFSSGNECTVFDENGISIYASGATTQEEALTFYWVSEQVTEVAKIYLPDESSLAIDSPLVTFSGDIIANNLTEWSTWEPTWSTDNTATISSVSYSAQRYCVIGNICFFQLACNFTIGVEIPTYVRFTAPIEISGSFPYTTVSIRGNGSSWVTGILTSGAAGRFDVYSGAWTVGTGRTIHCNGWYSIA